MINIPT